MWKRARGIFFFFLLFIFYTLVRRNKNNEPYKKIFGKIKERFAFFAATQWENSNANEFKQRERPDTLF